MRDRDGVEGEGRVGSYRPGLGRLSRQEGGVWVLLRLMDDAMSEASRPVLIRPGSLWRKVDSPRTFHPSSFVQNATRASPFL